MYKICTAQTSKKQRLIATDEGVEGDIERSRHDDETVYARKAFAFAPRSNFASGNTRSLYEPVFGDFLFVQNLFKVVAEGGKGCVRCVLHVDFFESEKIIERTAEIIRKRKSVFKTRNGYLAYPLVNCRRIEIQILCQKVDGGFVFLQEVAKSLREEFCCFVKFRHNATNSYNFLQNKYAPICPRGLEIVQMGSYNELIEQRRKTTWNNC